MQPLGKLTGSVFTEHGRVVLAVCGEIDVATAPQFRALVDAALAFGATHVTVDMTEVAFIDAQALTILTRAAGQLKLVGGSLALKGLSAQSHRVLEATHLLEVLGAQLSGHPVGIDAERGLVAMIPTIPTSRDVLDAALALVVTMAATVIKGADGVSITRRRHGKFVTVASSDSVVLGMDHDQYETQQGPCLDAAQHGHQVLSQNLRHERRWPEFVPRARARGIESILSTPLLHLDRRLGALNVYSQQADVVTQQELEWVDRFAAGASVVLVHAESSFDQQALLDDLQERLTSRDVIAVAQGVLMERDGLTQQAAHATMINTSRLTSQPLLGVCTDVVASTGRSGGQPDPSQ